MQRLKQTLEIRRLRERLDVRSVKEKELHNSKLIVFKRKWMSKEKFLILNNKYKMREIPRTTLIPNIKLFNQENYQNI